MVRWCGVERVRIWGNAWEATRKHWTGKLTTQQRDWKRSMTEKKEKADKGKRKGQRKEREESQNEDQPWINRTQRNWPRVQTVPTPFILLQIVNTESSLHFQDCIYLRVYDARTHSVNTAVILYNSRGPMTGWLKGTIQPKLKWNHPDRFVVIYWALETLSNQQALMLIVKEKWQTFAASSFLTETICFMYFWYLICGWVA